MKRNHIHHEFLHGHSDGHGGGHRGKCHVRHHDHHEKHCGERGHGKKTRLKRLFERGDLQLLLLLQLKEKSSHGYELIKSINDATSGLYEPSPGVLYPTLSMLEDQEMIVQDPQESNRKVYMITTMGLNHLTENESRITMIKERLESTQNLQEEMSVSNDLDEAIRQFKILIRHQVRYDQISKDQMDKIVEIINNATLEIEKAYEAMVKQK